MAKPIPQKPAWLDSDSEKEFRSSRALLDFIKRTRTFDAHELIAQQNQLLGDLHLESHRKLSTPKAQEVIQASAASDDFDFFIRLGKVLSQKAFEIDALVFLLVREWTERRKGISSFYRPFLFTGPRPDAPLCFFTDPALVQYCCFRLPLTPPGYSPASAFAEYQWSIPKTARRLGLKGASRKLVRKVSKKPNGQLLFE